MARQSARLREFLRGLDDPRRRPLARDPRQRPARLFPGLSAQPFHDPRQFPFTAQLEAAYPTIRQEMRSVVDGGGFVEVDAHRELVSRGHWRRFPLFNYGHRYDAFCRACPRTSALLEGIDGAREAGIAYFSALLPGSHIAPHCGPTNTRIRCHLPLLVPRGCSLTVAGERRRWRTGRCLVFDDSFEHEAQNDSPRTRIVLVVDVWHPELTGAERTALARRFQGQGGLMPQAPPSAAPSPSLSAGALAAFAHLGAKPRRRRG